MALDKRLKRWVDAQLIEPGQALRILEFERGQERPLFLYAVAGLGAVAIAVGVVSIVAANWELIPGRVKIATDLCLMLTLGLTLGGYRMRLPGWVQDVMLIVLYGLTMGSIALVGQTYQLGGNTRQAMTLWSLLTLPLMMLGRSGFIAALGSIGLQVTIAVWCNWLAEYPNRADGWAVALAGVTPWVWLSLGSSTWLQRLRPAYASVLVRIGWAELVFCASIGAHSFYHNMLEERWNELFVGLGASALMAAWLWRRTSARSGSNTEPYLLLAVLLLTFVPARFSPGHWDLVGALLFIGLWLLVAWSAHTSGLLGILNLATAVIGIRLIIVYFEVFGSLLNTGLGLVSGGGLTLLLAWLWWRKGREFKRQLGRFEERVS